MSALTQTARVPASASSADAQPVVRRAPGPMSIAGRPRQAEQLVNAGRVILAVYLLAAVFVGTNGSGHPVAVYVAIAYAAYSVAVIAVLRNRPQSSHRAQLIRHVLDLIVVSALILTTDGTSSPFVQGFLFSLICAALLFDTAATRATAVATVILYVLIIAAGVVFFRSGIALDRFIIRLGFLTVTAALVVQLKIHGEGLRSDYSKLADWPRTIPLNRDHLLEETMRHAASILRVPRLMIVWEYASSSGVWVGSWTAGSMSVVPFPDDAEPVVSRSSHAECFMTGTRMAATLHRAKDGSVREIDSDPLSARFRARWSVQEVAACRFQSEAVSGWLLALDRPEMNVDDLFLTEIVASLAGARLEQFRLAEHAQQHAITEERLRTARDLHDGILQSLSGTAFHVQLLRELMKRDPSAALFSLDDIEHALVDDQREVRSFVAQLRSALPPSEESHLAARLSTLCDRIERDWGIKVTLHITPLIEVIAPGMADAVYRIVKEALTNVANHADASRVRVDVAIRNARTFIVVDDNGRGFPFRGRLRLGELRELKRGPVTLKERIAALNGDLVIDSRACGARLEIELPLTLAETQS